MSWLKTLLFGAAAIYLALALLLFVAQEKLIFHPTPSPAILPPQPPGWSSIALALQSSDNTLLTGWLLLPPGGPVPLVMYFGGNAEDISWQRSYANQYGNAALLLMNYRGYGGSDGAPGERALLADALAVYDQITARGDIRAAEIFVHGSSLGSGVAVHVARERAVKGLILTTPFDSLEAVAKNAYPFMPIPLLLRHRFNSLERAAAITRPALFLVAENDRLIPPAHAKALFDSWRGPKQWHLIAGRGHNDISDSREYWDSIALFLKTLS